jgi:hypothetical protein
LAHMKVFIPVLFALLTCLSAIGQQKPVVGDKIKTITLNDTISYVCIDRPGDIYAITNTGQIQQFDKNGNLTLLYKAEMRPTLFDPRDGARLFAYYRKDQHYEFLSPSFEPLVSYKIDPSFAIQPWLICPSGEYKLWILDKVDQSLKKVNVKSAEVEVEVMVDSSLIKDAEAFKTMREYQNYVFLLDPARGIFIFNSLGKHIRTLDLPGVESFNFVGEDLYYLRNGSLEFFNLFTGHVRQMQIPSGYNHVLVTDERMTLFTLQAIDIFAFHP